MNARQETILKLIRTKAIGNQKELQTALAESGFPVAQATISRDIRILGLIKKADDSRQYCYREPEKENVTENPAALLLADNVLQIDSAGNVLVIRCNAGTAQAVCTRIDGMQLSHVVGTLAGDDTIFVLVRTPEQAQTLAAELAEKFQNR
ncbi:MAG: arginine repressor [Oscillospiraceae bacterium]|nr:arginine repressor [Oscillospiraceae bacterium]